MSEEPTLQLTGQFLVATPVISTPPFERSVILLLEHDESGAIGLVLNAPTDLQAVDHIPDIDALLSDPPVVFLGGPVSSDTAVSLAHGVAVEFLRPNPLPAIGLIDLQQSLDGVDKLRIFAGYSGWEEHQLEAELEEGAWWALYPDIEEIFAENVEGMWERNVERGPGNVPFYATYPLDPSVN